MESGGVWGNIPAASCAPLPWAVFIPAYQSTISPSRWQSRADPAVALPSMHCDTERRLLINPDHKHATVASNHTRSTRSIKRQVCCFFLNVNHNKTLQIAQDKYLLSLWIMCRLDYYFIFIFLKFQNSRFKSRYENLLKNSNHGVEMCLKCSQIISLLSVAVEKYGTQFLGGDLSDKMQIIQTHDRLPSHTLHTHLHLKLIRAYI